MTHLFGQLLPSQKTEADGGSFTGRLTSLTDHFQPINFMPRFSGVAVNVALIE